MGRLPRGTGLSASLKPRLCRVFTLRASIPDAALAGSIRPRALKDRSRRARVRAGFRDGFQAARVARGARRGEPRCPDPPLAPGFTRKSPTRSLPNWKQAVCLGPAVENGGGAAARDIPDRPHPRRTSTPRLPSLPGRARSATAARSSHRRWRRRRYLRRLDRNRLRLGRNPYEKPRNSSS